MKLKKIIYISFMMIFSVLAYANISNGPGF